MARSKCALVIGHRVDRPGAVNLTSNVSEFVYNDDLARRIEPLVTKADIVRIYRNTYRGLPAKINHQDPSFIVSLHANAFNRLATGTEVLHFDGSIKGKKIAAILQRHLLTALELNDRGIKPRDEEHRGGYLLANTRAPCVIAEPFFIDNHDDFRMARDRKDRLATAIARAIDEMAEALAPGTV